MIKTKDENIGELKQTEIVKEIKKAYLDYAMSVIVSRALPDVRDGLKPVHRRILYGMRQMGLNSSSRFSKTAKIVGEVLGKYHPHSDAAVYDALVRLAQDFSLRYPLVTGQGNFGSVDGDPPAQMRYTEAKPAKISKELLTDIEKDTVEFMDNFDSTLKEPVYLPAKLPNLLLMGAEGIAVGMATKIPPHNLNEVIDALKVMLEKGRVVKKSNNENKDQELEIKKINLEEGIDPRKISFESQASIEDLLRHIKGPDFPTGATIYDFSEIVSAYSTGKGKILIRAVAEIEEDKKGRQKIIISEIPYQVNKSKLVASIAKLVRDKKIIGINDLRDESDRQGMRIMVECKKSSRPRSILNNLYKHTSMQTSFAVNIVALVEGVPQTLNLKQILTEFLRHRQQIITRRTIFELEAAKNRAHILEGLKIALDNLDAVIATIRKSQTVESARSNLMAKFKLSEIQANAILEMQLRRLAALERKKIEDEYKEVQKQIAYLTGLLSQPEKILKIVGEELEEIKKTYGDARRTKVYKQKLGEYSEEDLIANQRCLIMMTKSGYVKRLPLNTYRSQRRGGKGVSGMTPKEADEMAHLILAETHDNILFFTNKGGVFSARAWEIAEGSRQAKGQAVINLINIEQGEEIQSILNIPSAGVKQSPYKYLIMATKQGKIKKTHLKHFQKIRSSGLIAIRLIKGDSLCWVKPSRGDDQVLLVSHAGKSIRFTEEDIRSMGRDSQGVRGISLKENDFVVGMEVFLKRVSQPRDKRKQFFRDVLILTDKGMGKRTDVMQYPLQKRGGIGVKAANLIEKTGKIVVAKLVTQNMDQIILTSKKGQVIKLPIKNIPQLKRSTQGVILMRFSKANDSIACGTCLKRESVLEEKQEQKDQKQPIKQPKKKN